VAPAPAILFVDGDLELSRDFAFNGVLFVTGSVVIDHAQASINGALIAGGEVALRAGRVSYAPNLIRTLQWTGHFAPMPGSRHERFDQG